MFFKKRSRVFLFTLALLNFLLFNSNFAETATNTNPIINKIIIEGSKHVKPEVILKRIPYKVGQAFDKKLTGAAINNLYPLGYFSQIKIETEMVEENKINLFIVIEEKKLLEKIEFHGNKKIKSKQFNEKLKLDKLSTIDEENLQQITRAIDKMYKEENHHNAKITFKIIPDTKSPDKAKAVFEINEGPASKIARVYFVGNQHIPSRKLSKIIFTRENWLLNFMDSSGQYNPEAVEMDKHRIEYFYRDHGYLMVKVADVKVEFSKDEKHIDVTFYIKEGDKFNVNKIDVLGGQGIIPEKELLEKIELEHGEPYSQSKLINSINNIKGLWGEKGYIYADVYPQVKPDEENKTVDVTLHSERGDKMYVHRIIISGNKVTLDKVIRRQLIIDEGDLITTRKLNTSQGNVEYLSFFEKGSVSWRIHKISKNLADLEIHVKETKTGQLSAGLNYGTDKNSPTRSLKGNVTAEKKNLFGRGWNVGGLFQADRHRINKLQLSLFDPNIFDTDVSSALNLYRQQEEFEQWQNLAVNDGNSIELKKPVEKLTGFDMNLGFLLPQFDKRLKFILGAGVEDINFNKPRDKNFTVIGPFSTSLQPIVDRHFQQGTLSWLTLDLVKDTRNHQVYPNHGYRYSFGTKLAIPGLNEKYSFIKFDLEASWYTPIIGEDSLVLMLHGKAGAISYLNDKKTIPYKELYHMGGQNTVRGFVWGTVGPAWVNGDPLGGRYAVQFNAELMFPLVPDYSMRGHVFYDAGAGWDTPTYGISDTTLIQRNKFDMRQSIGFGLNLMQPMPAKIDWGYKLDKRKGESSSELHLSMNYAW
ncbi:MAG: outer membrane protein assembly factor BamA [bacterium]